MYRESAVRRLLQQHNAKADQPAALCRFPCQASLSQLFQRQLGSGAVRRPRIPPGHPLGLASRPANLKETGAYPSVRRPPDISAGSGLRTLPMIVLSFSAL